MKLHPVAVKTCKEAFLRAFEERNALLTVQDGLRCNPMTIGWCQVGTLWKMPVCTVYVRPERYTEPLMAQQEYFTVSVLPEERKDVVAYCGSHSGRDTDKLADCGLTVGRGAGNAPFIQESELVMVCRKLFVQEFQAQCVCDERVLPYYEPQQGGWHRGYIGEIVEAYRAE